MSSITKKVALATSAIAAFSLPMLALAQTTLDTTGLEGLLGQLVDIFNDVLVPVLVAIAVMWLIIAAFQFALSGGDEEKRKAARDKIIWGLVGVVLIFAIYGIIGIVAGVFTSDETIPLPPVISI